MSITSLIPGAFKPFHKGHWDLMKIASENSDKVILFVSLLDRENIIGSDMARIWRDYILPVLPPNVSAVFLESSPVSRIYQILKLRESNPFSEYKFKIYSDIKDIEKNFNHNIIRGIVPNIADTDIIQCIGIERNKTTNITGAKMREFIRNGDFKSFSEFMPDEISKKEVFNILATLHEKR